MVGGKMGCVWAGGLALGWRVVGLDGVGLDSSPWICLVQAGIPLSFEEFEQLDWLKVHLKPHQV